MCLVLVGFILGGLLSAVAVVHYKQQQTGPRVVIVDLCPKTPLSDNTPIVTSKTQKSNPAVHLYDREGKQLH